MPKNKFTQLVSLNISHDTENEDLSLEDKENIKQKMIDMLNTPEFWSNLEHYDTEKISK